MTNFKISNAYPTLLQLKLTKSIRKNSKLGKKLTFFLSSRVYSFWIPWKALQKPSFNQNCECVPYHLNNSLFTFNLSETITNNSESTWWQQNAIESWHSLLVDTTFSARKTLHNYKPLDTGQESPANQVAGSWESTRHSPFPHNSTNRRARQPLCVPKFLQDAW